MSSENFKQLVKKGWKYQGTVPFRGSIQHCWEHPDHQPTRGEYFTFADALMHQRMINKGYECECKKRVSYPGSSPICKCGHAYMQHIDPASPFCEACSQCKCGEFVGQ